MNRRLSKLKTLMTALSTLMITTRIIIWIILCSNNPINISLLIIFTAVLVSITLGLLRSSWYSIILFLIYVGGIIVMFSYFVRLSSNDPIILKTKLHFIILPFILVKRLNLQIRIQPLNSIQILKLFHHINTIILFIIILILLIVMIVAVKIVKTNNGPLRGFSQCY